MMLSVDHGHESLHMRGHMGGYMGGDLPGHMRGLPLRLLVNRQANEKIHPILVAFELGRRRAVALHCPQAYGRPSGDLYPAASFTTTPRKTGRRLNL